MLYHQAEPTLTENSHEPKALQQVLRQFGVLLSLTQVRDVANLPKAQAIRKLLDLYDAGHRPITEDLIRQIHRAFLEEVMNRNGRTARNKSLL